MADMQEIIDTLSKLTVIEAMELSKSLEQLWGVSATQQVQTAAPVVVQEVAEEQSEFSVILTGVDPARKINVIKEVRSITGLGLKEAKEFTEAAGPDKLIKDSLSRDDALGLVKRLEEAGAKAVMA